jgi:hypothetical protein
VKWNEAIKDAKKHIDRIEAVIRTLEEKRAKGEPWPASDRLYRDKEEV